MFGEFLLFLLPCAVLPTAHVATAVGGDAVDDTAVTMHRFRCSLGTWRAGEGNDE